MRSTNQDQSSSAVGCAPGIVSVEADVAVRQAARRMVDEHVGSIVVLEDGVPVGMATDRDVTLAVLRNGADPGTTPIRECMSSPLITVGAQATLEEVATTMRTHQVRRVARVDTHGDGSGTGQVTEIVALDDVVAKLGDQWSRLARLVARERRQEPSTRESRPPIFGRE